MLRFTGKSVRQTFWIGVILIAASIIWLFGSIAATPWLSPNAHAWVGILPSALLVLVGCGFLGTWAAHRFNQLFGIEGQDKEDSQP
jgi:hypothetical protein